VLAIPGRRWAWGVLTGLLLSLAPVAPAAPIPPNDLPLPARPGSVACTGDLDAAPRPPVLLVPGTGLTPRENWAPTYLPVLRHRGHAVCLVRLPAFGTLDVQRNITYVAAAIRAMGQRSERRISVIGHSQGAYLPRAALRTWPELARHVADVVGVAGVYDRGSTELVRRCVERCLPVLHQLATGSELLRSIARLPLPSGPSYTSIGARGDLTVTPQPAANRQPGTTSLFVQDVCPGHVVPEPQHAMIIGDAVALALVLDAIDHRGTAYVPRISRLTCLAQQYPEFDEDAFLGTAVTARGRRLAAPVPHEPVVWCRYRPGCTPRHR